MELNSNMMAEKITYLRARRKLVRITLTVKIQYIYIYIYD